MTELSPQAQAIWEAFNEYEAGIFVDYGGKLAAAFKTAADILREAYANEEPMDHADDWLYDIAAELRQ
jgi:hypothetical protein